MEKERLKKLSKQNLRSSKSQTFNNTTAIAVSPDVTVIVHSSHKELIANLEKLRDDLKNKKLHR
ncbi:MAG: hypothetical protein YK1309IOTA_470005 [Marine Group I thaumarchaeote]|nr:MAG: hypothetical protein YK1309IOTA_470005 [Marine Group I thaumarchaeote]